MDENNCYGTYKVQKKLLESMKIVHNFCIENGIVYSLCGGSLLGAVREKGFIPWDDDMDIVMDRKNFERFINLCRNQDEFEIVTDLWVPRIVSKSVTEEDRACIDIFIFDNVPARNFSAKLKVFALKTLQGMIKNNVNYKNYSLTERILLIGTAFLGKFFTFKFKLRLYELISKWGNCSKTEFINAYNDLYKLLGLRYPQYIMNVIKATEFEETELFIMAGYDEYLTIQYGDYKTPPPVSQRIPIHLRND